MRRILLALASACIVACNSGTAVHVENRSSIPLHDVRVAGSGYDDLVSPSLGPGESRVVRVRPRGESGLALSFSVGARRLAHAPQGYFEGNDLYTVHVVVHEDLSPRVQARLKYR